MQFLFDFLRTIKRTHVVTYENTHVFRQHSENPRHGQCSSQYRTSNSALLDLINTNNLRFIISWNHNSLFAVDCRLQQQTFVKSLKKLFNCILNTYTRNFLARKNPTNRNSVSNWNHLHRTPFQMAEPLFFILKRCSVIIIQISDIKIHLLFMPFNKKLFIFVLLTFM